MNVGELRKELEGIPDDIEVIASIDGEGNAYNSVWEVAVSKVQPDGHQWDVLHSDDIEDDPDWGMTQEQYDAAQTALVIWP